MSPNPFDPTFDQLPEIVPIFPLTGVLLLPRGKLPLNVFEPRYLAMTEDALSGNRMIGIIQPSDPLSRASVPPVYPIGCAGRITSFSETDDGRYLITLTGVCRFETVRELPIVRGYRRVDVSWERFAADLEESGPALFDRARLVEGLKTYFKIQGISANWDAIELHAGREAGDVARHDLPVRAVGEAGPAGMRVPVGTGEHDGRHHRNVRAGQARGRYDGAALIFST